jgi:dinuclear metal center YbgI/SA1388 family protein
MKNRDIFALLESFAPSRLAYNWDNAGLLVGNREAETERILLTLDITPSVVDYAVAKGFDLIISHHPLIINPLKRITNPMLLKLIENKVAVFTMHTNLDIIKDGVNKALADKFGLQKREFISCDTPVYHIALYAPPVEAQRIADAVHAAGGGIIGNYSHCLNSYTVDGQFKPLSGSNPVLGTAGELEEVREMKLEFFVDEPLLDRVKEAIHNSHPYETPAYSIYPLHQTSLNYGLGVIGEREEPCSLKELALAAKECLSAPFVKLWLAGKTADTMIRKIAVCGGSGSSLIEAVTGKADVFISADFTYHKILESTIPLIDAGHYYTEFPVLEVLRNLLHSLEVETEIIDIKKGDIEKLICR